MPANAVYVRNWDRQRIAVLDQAIRVTIVLKENGVSSAEVDLPGWVPDYLLQPDYQLEFTRATDGPERVVGNKAFFIRRKRRRLDGDGGEWWELTALSAETLLDGRTIAYDAGSAEADKTKPADDMITSYVDENLVSATDASRNVAAISIATSLGAGPSVSKAAGRQNLLRVVQEVANQSEEGGVRLVFGFVGRPDGRQVLVTWTKHRGLDRCGNSIGAQIVFSPEMGNLIDASYTLDFTDEVTTAYAAGPGQGDDRLVVTSTDAARDERTPYSRREAFVSGGTDAAQVQGEADAAVTDGKPLMVFEGEVANGHPSSLFQVHWDWGDLVRWQWGRLGGSAVVDPVTIEWANGGEGIKATLRGEGRVAGWDATAQIMQQVMDLQRRLSRQTSEGAPHSNYNAGGAPTVNDDADDGYQAGSEWFDSGGSKWYKCRDATVGAAVWDMLN